MQDISILNMAQFVEATCLCAMVKGAVKLGSAIPVQTVVCHCDSCRYTKGTLFYSSLRLASEPEFVSALDRYYASTTITRYFCGTCGTHMCYCLVETNTWYLSSGVVDRIIENEQVFGSLEHITEHIFVGDTADGGLAVCLTGSLDAPARLLRQHSSSHVFERPEGTLSSERPRSSTVLAGCHCGGVRFHITRPNSASTAFSAPWPDLIKPYHLYSSDNTGDTKWWVCGTDKYLAGTCACRTCRLASASPLTCWAFIPTANIRNLDGSSFDCIGGSLSSFESSPGTYRGFCTSCGASVFWRSESRPELLDISVGILRAEEGSLARSWLHWHTDRVSFSEDAFDKVLVTAFASKLHLIEAGTRDTWTQ